MYADIDKHVVDLCCREKSNINARSSLISALRSFRSLSPLSLSVSLSPSLSLPPSIHPTPLPISLFSRRLTSFPIPTRLNTYCRCHVRSIAPYRIEIVMIQSKRRRLCACFEITCRKMKLVVELAKFNLPTKMKVYFRFKILCSPHFQYLHNLRCEN